jgi:hypothetical protein
VLRLHNSKNDNLFGISVCSTCQLRTSSHFRISRMSGIRIGGRFFAFDCFVINLEGLNLSDHEITSMLGHFSRGILENVVDIILNGHLITDLHADMIGKGLKSSGTLLQLHLNKNWIGDRGAEMIAKGLMANKTLRFLDLVRRFHRCIALDVHYVESRFQECRYGFVFVQLNSARSYWFTAGWQ